MGLKFSSDGNSFGHVSVEPRMVDQTQLWSELDARIRLQLSSLDLRLLALFMRAVLEYFIIYFWSLKVVYMFRKILNHVVEVVEYLNHIDKFQNNQVTYLIPFLSLPINRDTTILMNTFESIINQLKI